jgi:phenylacetate-CoA ligase
MIEPEVEARPWGAQRALDEERYRRQVRYLLERSRLYGEKLHAAGFRNADAVGGLDRLHELPLTGKDELRAARGEDDPIGAHLCVPMDRLIRIFSTSGTTGTPMYIPLTRADLDSWTRISARSYGAAGLRPGQRIVSTYNAGPFVAAVGLAAFDRIGLCHIPVGSGNTERLMTAVERLRPHAVALTPSYALHLAERAAERGFDLRASGVERLVVAGEPGGGEPAMRARLQEAWGALVMEAMGIGDIAASLWGECEQRNGMHFGGRDLVHLELIEPESGAPVPLEDGAEGELVLTHLAQEAAPLLRFRTRDHVRLWTSPCPCGRTAPRVRCIGRTDDMLIVRGVNLFPSAVREVVSGFAPAVSGVMVIRPRAPGPRQEPPLPVTVELAPGEAASPDLASRIRARIREALLVSTLIELVPHGSLPRSDYKSKLVDPSATAS